MTASDDSLSILLFELLSKHTIFQATSAGWLRLLVASASYHEAKRHTLIAQNDEPFPYMGVVTRGVVAATLCVDGARQTRTHAYEARAGETFGEIAAVSGVPPIGDIMVASRDAAYALIPGSALAKVMMQDPYFSTILLKRLAERSRALAQRLAMRQREPVISRVARVLLDFAPYEAGMHAANPDLLQLTQHEIAAMAGCAKEVAARTIGHLESAGALRRERGHIKYLARDVLQRTCDGVR